MKTQKEFFIFQILIIEVLLIFAGSCKKDTDQGIPVLSTIEVTDITQITAMSSSAITSNGGFKITARGVCWSTSENPTIAENFSSDQTAADTVSSILTGLTTGTTYYVRAYASNYKGTGYGNTLVFQTLEPNVPILPSIVITNITQVSAKIRSIISSNGGLSVTARGVCWSTSEDPSIADNMTSEQASTDTTIDIIRSKLTGLTPSTTYYARAYATNSKGTAYSQNLVIRTVGYTLNGYKIVTVGDRMWMAENYKYLPRVDSLDAYSIGTPYYFVYGYDGIDVKAAKATANYVTYGVLYNKEAAMHCPSGWHLPSKEEWLELKEYLDSGELTGFDLSLGGYRKYGIKFGTPAQFQDIGNSGTWWSSTSTSPFLTSSAWRYSLTGGLGVTGHFDEEGLSVRYVIILNYN